jgi:putative SOS response-associated peptidase YedK
MRGRYTLTADLKNVADHLGAPQPLASATYNLRFNIAPTQAAIVVGDDGNRDSSMKRGSKELSDDGG